MSDSEFMWEWIHGTGFRCQFDDWAEAMQTYEEIFGPFSIPQIAQSWLKLGGRGSKFPDAKATISEELAGLANKILEHWFRRSAARDISQHAGRFTPATLAWQQDRFFKWLRTDEAIQFAATHLTEQDLSAEDGNLTDAMIERIRRARTNCGRQQQKSFPWLAGSAESSAG